MATIMIRLRALETTFCPRSEDIVYEVQSPGGQDSEHYKNKVSTCQDTYMYIFIYAYTCIDTHTHAHAHLHVYLHVHVHVHVHVDVDVHVGVY